MRLGRLLVLLALAACGGDSSAPADAAVADAAAPEPVDATTVDQSIALLCQIYCSCMAANCPAWDFPTADAGTQACLDFCPGLTPEALDCRIYHCDAAAGGNGAIHCPHAEGMAICQ